MASQQLRRLQQQQQSSPLLRHNNNSNFTTEDHTQRSSPGNLGPHHRRSSGATSSSRHWQVDNLAESDSLFEAAASLPHRGGVPSANFMLQCMLQQELSLKAGSGASGVVGPTRMPSWPADGVPSAGAVGSTEAMLQALGADSDFLDSFSRQGASGFVGTSASSAPLAAQRMGSGAGGRFQGWGLLGQQQGHSAPAVRCLRNETVQDFGVSAGSNKDLSPKGLHSAAGLSPEVLRAFLSGSTELNSLQASTLAGMLDAPTSATSALLGQWLQDMEGGSKPRHRPADQMVAATQQGLLIGSQQGLSQTVPSALEGQGVRGSDDIIDLALAQLFQGSGATGDGLASMAGAAESKGESALALAQALLSAQANPGPSRARVSFNLSEGPVREGNLGRGSHRGKGLDGALGGAVQAYRKPSHGKGCGVLTPPESRSTCSQRGPDRACSPLEGVSLASLEASLDGSFGGSMGASMEGSAGGRREPRTEDDRRKRKLALNREAARRMRLRQATRLEQLEKMVSDLQAANQATQSRLDNAEKKATDLTQRNEGLEDRVVEVVRAITAREQPDGSLKEKLAALTHCLSAKALEKMPEGLEGLQKGEVVEECEEVGAGEGSSDGHRERKERLNKFDEEGRHPGDCHAGHDEPDEAVEQCLEDSPTPQHALSDS